MIGTGKLLPLNNSKQNKEVTSSCFFHLVPPPHFSTNSITDPHLEGAGMKMTKWRIPSQVYTVVSTVEREEENWDS